MKLSCKLKADKLPIGYNMKICSLLKEALKTSDEEYFKKLYYYGEDKANKKSKDFCYSVYINNPRIEGKEILCDNYIIINVSSPNEEFMLNLYNGLVKFKNYKLYGLKKENIKFIPSKEVLNRFIICNTLSPIYIQDKDKNPLMYYDKNFLKEFRYMSDLILRNYRGYGLLEEIDFIPLDMKKIVCKERITKFTKITGKEYMYLNANKGIFALKGNPKDLNDLSNLGLGFKRNEGYGSISILR